MLIKSQIIIKTKADGCQDFILAKARCLVCSPDLHSTHSNETGHNYSDYKEKQNARSRSPACRFCIHIQISVYRDYSINNTTVIQVTNPYQTSLRPADLRLGGLFDGLTLHTQIKLFLLETSLLET